ncbi:tetratricopeptide repeat protein [bacterium]|nr:tetratricopeptide repeat protein [bacterium]
MAGRRDEAVNTLAKGIAETDSRELKVAKANMHQAFEQYEASRDAYLALLEEEPDLTLAKNNLAMLYADYLRTPENLAKARELAAELQEQDSPAVLDTVGWVFYRLGDYQQAITYLQAAVDKIGNSPLLQYHLGMAYYGSGDLGQAKKYLQESVNPPQPYFGLDEAKATLEKINQQIGG